MEKLKLKNGKEVNLEITYGKLFEFQRKYKDIAKDLIEVVTRKQTTDHETIMQLIYIGYLGGKNEEPILTYDDFLNELGFDFERDLTLFSKLVKNNDGKN